MPKFEGVEYYIHKGIPVVIDVRYDIYINDSNYTTIFTTTNYIEECIIGLLISDGLIDSVEEIKRIDIKEDTINVYLHKDVMVERIVYDECTTISDKVIRVENGDVSINWETIINIYRDFVRKTASIKAGLAIHSSGIYDINEPENNIIVHDSSRHISILKLIGLAVKNRFKFKESLVITSGRVSSDMVYRLARLNVPIILSLRGPLSSGLTAAQISGVTLIANVRKKGRGRGLTILTHAKRIIFEE
jgi:FdhD protein